MTYTGEKAIKTFIEYHQNKIEVTELYSKPNKIICATIRIPIGKKWLFFTKYKYYDCEIHYKPNAITLDTHNQIDRIVFFDFVNHTLYIECDVLRNTEELASTIIYKAYDIIKEKVKKSMREEMLEEAEL